MITISSCVLPTSCKVYQPINHRNLWSTGKCLFTSHSRISVLTEAKCCSYILILVDCMNFYELVQGEIASKQSLTYQYVFLLFQGKFNFPSDVEVSNNARDLMQRCVPSSKVIVSFFFLFAA